jgi:hypothetical protein
VKRTVATALTCYGAWLVAVVLLVAGRYTPFPLLPGVESGVVAGALVFTVLGAVQLGRRGLRAVTARL